MPLIHVSMLPFEAFNFFVSIPLTLAIVVVPIAYAIKIIGDL